MAKYLVRLFYLGSRIIGKAFSQALKEEIRASQEAARRTGGGVRGQQHVQANITTGMSLDEAMKILNIEKLNKVEDIQRNFEYLMKVNDRSKGGSFYLQSKILVAKQRIDMELKEQTMQKTKQEVKAQQDSGGK